MPNRPRSHRPALRQGFLVRLLVASLAYRCESPIWKDLHRFERVKDWPEPSKAMAQESVSPYPALPGLLAAGCCSLFLKHTHTHILGGKPCLANSFYFASCSCPPDTVSSWYLSSHLILTFAQKGLRREDPHTPILQTSKLKCRKMSNFAQNLRQLVCVRV